MSEYMDTIWFTFPYPETDRSHEAHNEPTFARLQCLCTQIKSNAISVQSDYGNGRIGHYRLVATAYEYRAKSHNGVDCVAPTNPKATLNVPGNASGPQIAKLHRKHKINILLFLVWYESDNALKVQIIAAINDCFIGTLKDNELGYSDVTDLNIINHLFSMYGTISY